MTTIFLSAALLAAVPSHMLTAQLATTQPNASKHLRLLQEAGFIGRRQAGTSVYYFVTDPSVFELCDVVCTALYSRMTAQARVFGAAGDAPRHRTERSKVPTRAPAGRR